MPIASPRRRDHALRETSGHSDTQMTDGPNEPPGTDASDPPVPPGNRPVGDILDRMRAAATTDTVTVATMLHAMNSAGHTVVLLIPALIVVTPLSGIPGLSTLGGLTIALIAMQMLLGRRVLWLPRFFLSRQMSASMLHRALNWLARPARLIDRISAPRLRWLFRFPGSQLLHLTCIACGLAMPFLELVPFSATTLALAVVIISVALMVRDGLLALLGFGSVGLAAMLIVWIATP